MKILRIGSTCGAGITLIKNVEDTRRFIENYGHNFGLESIVGDLSNIGTKAQSAMLKFLEEGVDDIICYASRDNVSPVLVSRFNKVEDYTKMKIERGSFSTFVKDRDSSESVDHVRERDFAASCANALDEYLLYRRLSKSVISRIGRFI